MNMFWFDRLFPVLMVITPALIVACTRSHETAVSEDAPAKARRVYAFTALALIAHAVAMVLFETQQEGRSLMRSVWVSGFSMFSFFFLWFACAGPALAARHPGWGNTQQAAPARTASLAARHVDTDSMLPAAAWITGWLLYAASIGVTIWSLLEGAHASLVVGLAFWPGFAWGVRSVRTEAEPMDAGGSTELAQAYADLRRFRAWCFYSCGASGTIAISLAAAAVALDLAHVGTIGGWGGALIGLLGAVMGTMATFRRARINGLLHDLNHEGNGGTA